MKSISVILLIVAAAQALTYDNACPSGGSPLIKLDSISPTGEISSNTKLSVRFTSTSTYTDSSFKAVLKLNIERKFWFIGYQSLPNFVFNTIGDKIAIKGVNHLSGSTFEIGCDAASGFLQQCPPKQGTYKIDVDLAPIFKEVNDNAGSVLKWIGSGKYKISAEVNIKGQTNVKLACVNVQDLDIKM